ncbi:MAG: TIGR03960 family B12-binding radical SAM protein [Caldithrix sp.]|nr:TIGR03960 family B12-binding radical SAM protein [Caldithrix sp.]
MTKQSFIDLLDEKILPFVMKPGRYIGNEFNVVRKNAGDVTVRAALAFPEVYEIGMSYVGYDILYHILNNQDQIWAERVFAPWPDMEAKMRETSLPLYSLESLTPLHRFDMIGFTLQYELTYTNVLNMLDLSGIPVWAKDRQNHHPLVIGGGPCASNPEPMAPFFDAFLIGDGEEAVLDICEVLQQAREHGQNRREILRRLSGIRGVYIPSFYEPTFASGGNQIGMDRKEKTAPSVIKTRLISKLEPGYYPHSPIVPLIKTTHDRLPVEVMRGCTGGCRYCSAGMIYRPVRERKVDDIIYQTTEAMVSSGYDELSFLSLSISDYSRLPQLIRESKRVYSRQNINVSFPSMRVDSFTPLIAEFAASVRKSGFTFAPEAGSERLRRVINKNISQDDLLRSVTTALDNGWRLLKFYFMIGLPTETKEDIEAIADLMELVVQASQRYGIVRFNVSISPFSPKPHTPFQWESQNSTAELNDKIKVLQHRFNRMRRIQFNWRDPHISLLECVLGRADRRMAQVIFDAWQDGAVFDGWSEYFNVNRWKRVTQDNGLTLEQFTGSLKQKSFLPWDHIDKGVTKKFLFQERENAYKEISLLNCQDNGCYACGIQRKGDFADHAECYKNTKPVEHSAASEDAVVTNENKNNPEQQNIGQVLKNDKLHCYRLQYQKTMLTKYLSHLDLMRIFERSFRRAGIRIAYTNGFNPHPKISSGPPLALGYTSEAEYMDVDTIDPLTDKTVERINHRLPDGLKIISYRNIMGKIPSLSSVINGAEYEINISNCLPHDDSFTQALNRLLAAEKIEIDRRVKGKNRCVDIRPYIISIQKSRELLNIKTRSIHNRTVRINEILQQLFSTQTLNRVSVPVHRKRQYVLSDVQELSPIDAIG